MKILTVPHRTLYLKAKPVGIFGIKLDSIIDRMFITMYRYKGMGLAANQVDILLQIVVMNVGHRPAILINPVIHDMRDGVMDCRESCLSIPNFTASIERARYIKVESFDRYGKKQNFEASGLLARCIQHECDHLHGILINEKRA